MQVMSPSTSFFGKVVRNTRLNFLEGNNGVDLFRMSIKTRTKQEKCNHFWIENENHTKNIVTKHCPKCDLWESFHIISER